MVRGLTEYSNLTLLLNLLKKDIVTRMNDAIRGLDQLEVFKARLQA